MSYFARAGALQGFPELVREYGQSPTDILREAGLSQAVLFEPDLYVPFIALARAFTLAAERCAAEDFGVRLGSSQGLEVVGALASCMGLQPTMGDALRIMYKNLAFHARGVHIDVRFEPAAIDLLVRFDFAREVDCKQLTGVSIAHLERAISQLNGGQYPLQSVWLDIPAPSSKASTFREVLGCAVHFEAGENRMRYAFTGDFFSTPVSLDQALREHLSHVWRLDPGQRETAAASAQVERVITALLPTGECHLEVVAKLLGYSPRKLQRLLFENGTSFSAVLQATRSRLACQNLMFSDMDITTLAMNLGFAEVAIFSRAFKAWTGLSPQAWRKARLSVG
ncbi:MAG: AraC family transcriptional regulator ligand-binding domain-containing protein [Moraxellaceae bacterium]